MILEYGGVDLSAFVTKYGFSEEVREIEGPNSGVSISGKEIRDILAVKIDPTFVLRPMVAAQITIIYDLVRALPTQTYNTLTYTSPEGLSRTIEARLETAGVLEKALENSSRTVFDGLFLTFRER